jgi:hypothetical protein
LAGVDSFRCVVGHTFVSDEKTCRSYSPMPPLGERSTRRKLPPSRGTMQACGECLVPGGEHGTGLMKGLPPEEAAAL